jgi:hypothetical protein
MNLYSMLEGLHIAMSMVILPQLTEKQLMLVSKFEDFHVMLMCRIILMKMALFKNVFYLNKN